jgi:hypothetical protein
MSYGSRFDCRYSSCETFVRLITDATCGADPTRRSGQAFFTVVQGV